MGYRFTGRKHPRLTGYDYRLSNPYFVTATTNASIPLFGHIDAEGLHLSAGGEMVQQHIQALPGKFPRLVLDEWVVMPDHIHLLLIIQQSMDNAAGSASLSDIMQWLKTMTTNAYIRGVKQANWPPFERKVWHTSFHDRIVRDDDELDAIRRYIEENPARRWARMVAENDPD